MTQLQQRCGLVVVFVATLAVGLLVGRHDANRDADNDHDRVVSQARADTIRIVHDSIRVDTVRVRVHEAAAQVARASFDSAAAVIEQAADMATVLPVSMVVPAIAACHTALLADSLLIADLHVTVDDALHLADLEHRRADLAEQQLAHARPRFGFKSGLTAGAAIAIAVIHLVR